MDCECVRVRIKVFERAFVGFKHTVRRMEHRNYRRNVRISQELRAWQGNVMFAGQSVPGNKMLDKT